MNKILLSLATLALTASASAQTSDPSEHVEFDLTLALSGVTAPNSKGCVSANKQLDSFFFVCQEKDLEAAKNSTANATIRSEEGDFEASAHLISTGGLNPDYSYFAAPFGKEPIYNGKYIITIDKEAFGDAAWVNNPESGHTNGPIELSFELIDGVERSVTALKPRAIVPAEGTYKSGSEIASITLTFEEGVEMVKGAKAFLAGVNSMYAEEGSFSSDGDGAFTVVFDPAPSDNATYRLTIHGDTFTDSRGNTNDRIELLYIIDEQSGITEVELSEDIPAVFNLQGVRVSYASLPSGIYVIKGKKVVIK